MLKVPHHGSRYQDEDWLRLARRRGRAGLGGRRQRLRPPGAPRRSTRSRRPGRGCCAPTRTATWRSSSATASWHVDTAVTSGPAVGALWQACRTMAGPSQPRAADVLGRVTLVTGKEEFLNERTVAAVRDAVRQYDAEAELSETVASDLLAGHARRARGPVAVLEHPLRGGPRPGEPPRGVGRRPARLRRGAGRGGRAGAGARRRPEGQRHPHQAAQAGHRHRVEVRRAAALGVPRASSPPRSAGTAPRSTRRPPTSWSRPSARTCARCRPRPTS